MKTEKWFFMFFGQKKISGRTKKLDKMKLKNMICFLNLIMNFKLELSPAKWS